jgi:hypothetical protein
VVAMQHNYSSVVAMQHKYSSVVPMQHRVQYGITSSIASRPIVLRVFRSVCCKSVCGVTTLNVGLHMFGKDTEPKLTNQ